MIWREISSDHQKPNDMLLQKVDQQRRLFNGSTES